MLKMIMNTFELQYLEAPTSLSRFVGRRNLTAQGAALCNEYNANFVAPRINIIQGGNFAWGKKKNVEYQIRNV